MIGRNSRSWRSLHPLNGARHSVLISPSKMDKQAKIYVGTAGWSYKDWEGIVYPAQIKKSQHPVEYLARYST